MFFKITLILTISFFLCLCGIAQGRSFKVKRDADNSSMWFPDDMSRDDWYRCHGFPCDQWERTKEKLLTLKVLTSQADQNDLSILDNRDEIIQKYNLHLEDDSLDGCIWLTEDQLDEIFEEKGLTNERPSNDHMMRKKRQVHSGVASGGFGKWPMPIHYKFDGEHSQREQDYIRSAVAHIEEQTCIDFKELATQEAFDDYHIIVTRRSTGCHSYVGRVGARPQQLNLQAGCIFAFGIPVHEFTHALGVWHEMQRWDRDDHLTVLWDNIGNFRSQFFKQSSNDLGTEYDTSSVMHYAGKDGARSGLNSMETINPLYQKNMGQRTGLSFRDAQLLNRLYCNDKCTTPLPEPCMRGGYQDPKDCSKCRCPPGFTGTYCEELAPSNAQCGGEFALNANGNTMTIESPSYSTLRYYDINQECNWRFTVPQGYKIGFRFVSDFGVYCGFRDACFHWVEVQYEAHRNTQGPRFCCTDAPRDEIVSEWNEMTVLFRSNYTFTSSTQRRGFRAEIHAMRDDDATPPTTTITQTTPTASTTTMRPGQTTPSTTTTPTTTVAPTTTTINMRNMNEECVAVDLSIALDSSGSVRMMGWQKMLRFVRDLLMRFEVSSSCTRVSMISFGTDGYLHSRLNEHMTSQEISDVILRMPFRDEWTNTAAAFRLMSSDVYVTNNGDRNDAMNVALIITDGPSNRESERTVPDAVTARNHGINFMTIGVGSDVNVQELEAITDDVTRNIYISSFDNLMEQTFIQSIFNQIRDISGMMQEEEEMEEEEEEEEENENEEFNWSCSFEDSNGRDTWCDVEQATDDQFDWSFGRGPTPSDPTGPDVAESGQFYIFIEATNRRRGDQARLQLPGVPTTNAYCLRFAYHMFGWHIDTLYVTKEAQNGVSQDIWSEHGEKGNMWLYANLNIDLNQNERLSFIGQRGGEYSGDIGLDSINLTTGLC